MAKSQFQDRAEGIVGRAEAAAGSLADDAKSQFGRVGDPGTQAPATAGRAYGQARDQMSGAAAAVASSVEQQPFVTPLAVGLVCGTVCFLLGRR
jgi:hypothetical protein